MKPGRELDKQVAEVMGYADFWQDRQTGEWYGYHPDHTNLEDERIPIPRFSTDGYVAWEAWEWLEKNQPWAEIGTEIFLGRHKGQPSVALLVITPNGILRHHYVGESYPHVIALTVIEAQKYMPQTQARIDDFGGGSIVTQGGNDEKEPQGGSLHQAAQTK